MHSSTHTNMCAKGGNFGVVILTYDFLRYYRVNESKCVKFKMLNPSSLDRKLQRYFQKIRILSSCNGLVLIGYEQKEKYFVGNPMLGVFTEPIPNGILYIRNNSCLLHEPQNNYFHIVTLEAKGENSIVHMYDSRTKDWESVVCLLSFVPGVKGISCKGGTVVWFQPGTGNGIRFLARTRECLSVPHVDGSQKVQVFADGSGLLSVDVIGSREIQFHKLEFDDEAEAGEARWESAGQDAMIPKCRKIRVMGIDSKRNIFLMLDEELFKYSLAECVFVKCFNLEVSLRSQGGAYFPHDSRGRNDLVPFTGSLELAGIIPESPLENVVVGTERDVESKPL